MDGASKFVKGDATAGILITVITGGVSMVIFFFVNKIIFPEAKEA